MSPSISTGFVAGRVGYCQGIPAVDTVVVVDSLGTAEDIPAGGSLGWDIPVAEDTAYMGYRG